MQSLSPILLVPRRFWDREYGGFPLPKAVNVTFEVAGQPVDDVSAHGFVSVAEDSELRLSGLWAVSHDRFPGHLVVGWVKVRDDTIKLQLQPADSAEEQHPVIDRKRQAPSDLPEPQAKVPALGARPALEWDSTRDSVGHSALNEWRPEGRDGPRFTVDLPQRLVAPSLVPGARMAPRRGGSAGRMRGGGRTTATGRGCAKLVRTTTRLYIGVGQVREWLGEVGARTELQVKVMLDNRMLFGNHQADLLYNKGAHYYWITSRTLKRTAMGKWFLGWSHTPADGLVLLLRSPSKDEIAAAIAEGFQGKDDDDETEMSEQLQQQQQMQQQMLMAMSPPSPRPSRTPQTRSLTALAYTDDDPMLQQQHPQAQQQPGSEMDDGLDGGGQQYQRQTSARHIPAGDEDDAASGLSGGDGGDLRRGALAPSDPRLMAALAAAEMQRGMYTSTPGVPGPSRRMTPGGQVAPPPRGYAAPRDATPQQQLHGGRPQPSPGPLGPPPGAAPGQYREPLARAGSEGMAAAAGGGAVGPSRGAAVAPPGRYTNFSEVPGGTAFSNVALPSEGLAAEAPMPLPPQQQQRGGGGGAQAAMPSQLGAQTSIASNLSLPAGTQVTGNASMLQASGVAGPITAPLRLPSNVSELLPPEYLPAAVSLRCTLDGELQPDVFSCEIHRSRQGHCYLYNLPPSVLEGRLQADWMISEDGCLVLCLKTAAAPPPLLLETKSVRSNPSNSQIAGALVGGGSVHAETNTGRASNILPSRPPPNPNPADKALGSGRPQQPKDLEADMVTAVAAKPQPPEFAPGPTGALVSPRVPEQADEFMQDMQDQDAPVDAVAFTTVVPPPEAAPVVAATLPVPDRPKKVVDGRREWMPQLVVPRQALESLYRGVVELPFPVLVRFQVNEEMESQVYLAEVVDTPTRELVIRGTPPEALTGRTLVGWRRTNVLSHQLLVVCLESRQEDPTLAKAVPRSAPARPSREEEPARRPPAQNAHHPHHPQQPPHLHGQPQQPAGRTGDLLTHRAGPADTHMAGLQRPHGNAAANPFGQQQQVSFSGAPTSVSQQRSPLMASAGPGPAAQRQHPQQQPQHPQHQHQSQRRPSGDSYGAPGGPQQPLQPMMSGPLPVVGSSKLPTSQSLLNNTGSSLLPAQASNLPFASSVRPDGVASMVAGGPGGGAPRQAHAGTRGPGGPMGSAVGTGAGGQRTLQAIDGESRGGALLPTVASVTQGPMQAPPQSRHQPPPAGLRGGTAPPGMVYTWPPPDGVNGAAQAAAADRSVPPSVFAQFGPGPPSPQIPSETAPQGARRAQPPPMQQQQQPVPSGQGRTGGGGGSGGSGSNDGGLMPRNTAQTADFSTALMGGSQARAAQQPPAQLQQPSLLQQAPRQLDEGDGEVRRSTAIAGMGGEQEPLPVGASRGRWPGQAGAGIEGDAAAAQGTSLMRGEGGGMMHEGAQPMRYVPAGHEVHRRGSGGMMSESPRPYGQDAPPPPQQQQHQQQHYQQLQHQQPLRARPDPTPSWRFEPQPLSQQGEVQPTPRLEQPPGPARSAAPPTGNTRGDSAPPPPPPHAVLHGSRDRDMRWGMGNAPPSVEACPAGGEDQQRLQHHYSDEPYVAASAGAAAPAPVPNNRPSRAVADEMDTARGDVPVAPSGQGSGRVLDGGDARQLQQGMARPREPVGGVAASSRYGYEDGEPAPAPDGDVEMEDAPPGTPSSAAVGALQGRPEAHVSQDAREAYTTDVVATVPAARAPLQAESTGEMREAGTESQGGRGRDRPGEEAMPRSQQQHHHHQQQQLPPQQQQPQQQVQQHHPHHQLHGTGGGPSSTVWHQRRVEGGHPDAVRQSCDQSFAAAAPSGPEPSARQLRTGGGGGGGSGGSLVGSVQGDQGPNAPPPPPQQWIPRLDLTGATARSQDRGGVETAAAQGSAGHHDDPASRQGLEEGEVEGEERPPQRRPGVLRMLSAVVREPEEGEIPQSGA